MSLAMDDYGYLSAIDALETSFIKTGVIEKKDAEKEVSGPEKSEPEINDVFEKSSDLSQKEKETELEKIQEEYNELEVKNKSLDKINSDLETIDKTLQKDPESSKKKEEALEKIGTLMSGVREKQSQIAEMQREIQKTVNSVVELKIGTNADSMESEIKEAELLRKSIVEEVKVKPETVKKLRIQNIDRNLILAMLSLRH